MGAGTGPEATAADLLTHLLAPATALHPVTASPGAAGGASPRTALRGLSVAPATPFTVVVTQNGVVAACSSSGACAGALDPSITPTVTSVTPGVSSGVNTLTITGAWVCSMPREWL
jgi:hypothetical protein